MKELLKDRIDVLMGKAQSGDGDAQLKLAKWFYKGHLVEKSTDQAKYWAFKSMLNGNNSACEYYQKTIQDNSKLSSKHRDIGDIITFISFLEFGVAFFLFAIMGILNLDDNIFYDIFLWIFILGIISIIISLLFGRIGEAINKHKGKPIGATIGFLIVHIVALLLAIH